MKIGELTEASGYIPKNAEEAKDPRWSSALTVDVNTHTMRDQLSAFYPSTAPDDGQVQIKENKTMTNQVNEAMGSVNVEQEYDVSRIKKLAGLANSSTVAGTPVAEDIYDDIESEDAQDLAAELEEQVEHLGKALELIEHTVKTKLPREYRSMEQYTFAHIKAAIGGYGYAGNRMSKTLVGLIEDLSEHGYEDEE